MWSLIIFYKKARNNKIPPISICTVEASKAHELAKRSKETDVGGSTSVLNNLRGRREFSRLTFDPVSVCKGVYILTLHTITGASRIEN